METNRIADLLRPFVGAHDLRPELLEQFRLYLELLLKWNARVNLTAVRDPEQIVTRHFGESVFAARTVLPDGRCELTIADIGSGAGFPGIPMKMWAPQAGLTLIESQNKKATFLREVIRALQLQNADAFCGRAEQWGRTADVVTLRAVEKFESVLPVASGIVVDGGRLCLLIGRGQMATAQKLLGNAWRWEAPAAIPNSGDRVVAVARMGRSPLRETS